MKNGKVKRALDLLAGDIQRDPRIQLKVRPLSRDSIGYKPRRRSR